MYTYWSHWHWVFCMKPQKIPTYWVFRQKKALSYFRDWVFWKCTKNKPALSVMIDLSASISIFAWPQVIKIYCLKLRNSETYIMPMTLEIWTSSSGRLYRCFKPDFNLIYRLPQWSWPRHELLRNPNSWPFGKSTPNIEPRPKVKFNCSLKFVSPKVRQ